MNLRLPKTISRPKTKRLQNVLFIIDEAGVISEPSLWDECVWKSKVGGGAVGGVVVATNDCLVGALAGINCDDVWEIEDM